MGLRPWTLQALQQPKAGARLPPTVPRPSPTAAPVPHLGQVLPATCSHQLLPSVAAPMS